MRRLTNAPHGLRLLAKEATLHGTHEGENGTTDKTGPSGDGENLKPYGVIAPSAAEPHHAHSLFALVFGDAVQCNANEGKKQQRRQQQQQEQNRLFRSIRGRAHSYLSVCAAMIATTSTKYIRDASDTRQSQLSRATVAICKSGTTLQTV